MKHTPHHPPQNQPTPGARAGARSGRALVECIVALLVLSVSALAMLASTRGTLALADDAVLVSQAQALATSRVEDALTPACPSASSGTDRRPRLTMAWQQSGGEHQQQLHLDVAMLRSPIAFRVAPLPFAIEAGGVCP